MRGRRQDYTERAATAIVEAAQAELGRLDRAVQATDELLELLAPLLVGNGSESAAAGDGSSAEAEPGGSGSKGGEAHERDTELSR